MVTKNGEKHKFEIGKASYYQHYQGQTAVAIYFRNKSKNTQLQITDELELNNLQLRDDTMEANDTTLNITLQPGEGKLVVIDAIERDRPYSFAESLGFETLQVT